MEASLSRVANISERRAAKDDAAIHTRRRNAMKITIQDVVYAEGESGPLVGVAAINGEGIEIRIPLTAEDRDRLITELNDLVQEIVVGSAVIQPDIPDRKMTVSTINTAQKVATCDWFGEEGVKVGHVFPLFVASSRWSGQFE